MSTVIFFSLIYILLRSWLTYSVYSVLLVLGVDSRDSLLTYNTQCSSQQVPSLMPITHPPLLLTPHQPSVCSQPLRVSYGLPPSLSVTFFPFPSPMVFCWVSQDPHMSENIWYLSFSAWLISLSIILSSSFHIAANQLLGPHEDKMLLHCKGNNQQN